jgi:fatty-acid desaturase
MLLYIAISYVWWIFLSSVIMSAGYHRYFSHRAFNAPIWYEYAVLFLGPLSGAGSVLGWVGVHRMHHAHSDTENDPHSPIYQPIWKILTSTFTVPAIKHRHIVDLLKNPRVMWFYRNHKIIRAVTLLLPLLVLPIEWYVVFFLSPIIYGYLGFGLLNTLCHSSSGVKNSWFVNLLTGGEGWHRNHHERPRDWMIGKKWYELDLGAWFIKLIKKY